ncbi:MAG TPA: DHA2 family efflux MFS transporter permease subunit [Solirubrobacteraceae bacterium]|nr:DHA2 family efflux MFS transporter permease subunit [Solirubrobacteraceae bacterium]
MRGLALRRRDGARSAAQLKRLTLLACIIGSGIGLLDTTIVNIALPTIQRGLGGGLSGEQWIVNAYLLTLGSLILVGGSLEDVFGSRVVFAAGVGGFGAASVLCGIAPSIGALVACRALEGLAGALLVPSSLAVIVSTFPEDQERGHAVGIWTAGTTIATVAGPLAGGALLRVASWRWLFFVNVPLVLVCLALIPAVIPRERRTGARRRIDLRGGGLCVLGLAGTVFALIEEERLGWGSPLVIGSLAGGIAVLVAFVLAEHRAPDPMLPLRLFARRNFTAANLETLAVYAGLSVLTLFLVLFLQQVAGYSPLRSGLALLPSPIVLFLASSRFGALAGRIGPRPLMSAGPLVAAAGLLLLLRVGLDASYFSEILPAVALFGLGMSMTVAPLTATVLSRVEPGEAGIASAVNNAVARVAGLLGTAAVGTVLAATFDSAFAARLGSAPLGSAGERAANAARHLVLGRPPVARVPAAQAHRVLAAANGASLESFHVAIAIAAGLLALGGLIGALGIAGRPPAQLGGAAEAIRSSSESG